MLEVLFNKSRLAAIVESTNDAIIGYTLEGIRDSWNAAEAVGKSVTMLTGGNKSLGARIIRLLATG